MIKNVLFPVSLVVSGVILVSKHKAKALINTYKTALKQVKMELYEISNLNVPNNHLKANIKLNLTNNSDVNFDFNSNGNIRLKRLRFYTHNNNHIGNADVNLHSIKLLAHSTITTPDLLIIIPLDAHNIGQVIADLIQNKKDITIRAEIDVLGQTYTV